MEVRYYICKHCGNIVEKVKDKGVPVICCGEPMRELKAGVTDAAVEKFHNICRKCRNIDRMGTDYRSLKNFESKEIRKSQWSKLEKIVHFRPIFRPFGGINMPR